jgi:hypothetical protein
MYKILLENGFNLDKPTLIEDGPIMKSDLVTLARNFGLVGMICELDFHII